MPIGWIIFSLVERDRAEQRARDEVVSVLPSSCSPLPSFLHPPFLALFRESGVFQGLIARASCPPFANFVPIVSKLNKVAGGMNKALFPAETPSAIHLRYSGIIREKGEGAKEESGISTFPGWPREFVEPRNVRARSRAIFLIYP